MAGSDSEEDIDDVESDNEGEEDIDQEIFDAIEAGAEDATEGDLVGSVPTAFAANTTPLTAL
jgi:hypothetical protein